MSKRRMRKQPLEACGEEFAVPPCQQSGRVAVISRSSRPFRQRSSSSVTIEGLLRTVVETRCGGLVVRKELLLLLISILLPFGPKLQAQAPTATLKKVAEL